MTEENILEKNLKVGSRKWLDNPLSLPLNLRGRSWGLWVTAAFFFLLPLQTRYIFRQAPLYEWGTLSIFVVEALGWVVIVLGVFTFRHSERSEESRTNLRSRICARSLAVLGMTFAGWAFISIIWAPDKAVALTAAVRLLEGVLLYAIISATVNPKSEIRNPKQIQNTNDQNSKRLGFRISNLFVWSFLAGAVLQAGLGIFQFLTQSSFVSTIFGMALHDPVAAGTAVVEFGDQRWLRAYGGLPHPNVLGGYLIVALAVLMLMMRRGRASVGSEARPPNIAFAIIPILLTGIFFTFSRAAWLVAAVAFLGYLGREVFLWRRERRTQNPTIVEFCVRNRFAWLIITYVVFLLVWYRPLVAARIFPDAENRLEVKSQVERVAGVDESWQLIKKHLVFGVGIGNYTQVVRREVRPGDPLYTYQPVHNVPLLIWAELGIFGLLLFIGLLYCIARQSKFYILHFTFLILLLLDHYLWSLPFGTLLFWGILGLSTYNPQDGLDKKTAL